MAGLPELSWIDLSKDSPWDDKHLVHKLPVEADYLVSVEN
jgi:hypothetical protein